MKTNKNRAPQGCRISNYKLFGFNGVNGIAEATVTDQAGRIAARINRGPQGFQAITPAMNYATEWHATEAEALAALFASGEWAYFGNATKQQPAELREFGPLGALFNWIDQHPRTASALLWIQGAALAWFAYTYNFTTTL